jgi:hypothetical protein
VREVGGKTYFDLLGQLREMVPEAPSPRLWNSHFHRLDGNCCCLEVEGREWRWREVVSVMLVSGWINFWSYWVYVLRCVFWGEGNPAWAGMFGNGSICGDGRIEGGLKAVLAGNSSIQTTFWSAAVSSKLSIQVFTDWTKPRSYSLGS